MFHTHLLPLSISSIDESGSQLAGVNYWKTIFRWLWKTETTTKGAIGFVTPIISICLLFHADGIHDDVMKWKHSLRFWPFVRGIQRPVTRSFGCFFLSAPEQTGEQTFETPVIWDTIALIMTPLWCCWAEQDAQFTSSYSAHFGRIVFVFSISTFSWCTDRQTCRRGEYITFISANMLLSLGSSFYKRCSEFFASYIWYIYMNICVNTYVCIVCQVYHSAFDYISTAMLNLFNYGSISLSLSYHVLNGIEVWSDFRRLYTYICSIDGNG